jgi:hypothetical protein
VDEEEEEVGGRGRLEEENEVSRAAADADVGAVEPTGELTDAVAATTASAAGRASAEGVEAAASTARSDVAMTERGGDDISPASVICLARTLLCERCGRRGRWRWREGRR